MRRISRIGMVCVMATASIACATDETTTQTSNKLGAAAPLAERPNPRVGRGLPPPVPVGNLPSHGLAVSDGKVTVLIDARGNVLRRLPGFDVAGNPGAAGLWLQRGRRFFRLAAGESRLTPISRVSARTKIYDEGPSPELPPPDDARVQGRVAGTWRYALAHGENLLAQWSGECEIPTAFWWTASGLRIVTGERRLAEAPESIALGWTTEGEALVLVGRGACAGSGEPPGIYRFTTPGDGTLIYETKGFVEADMW